MSLFAGPAQPAKLKMTVVTVCRNAVTTVEKTIQSVLWQDYPDLEYVVIDGMSTDGTWEILQQYRDRLSRVLHEPDTGIYNAMNKGIRVSTGDVLVFMNADDYFVSPYVLSRVAAAFAARPELDIVYGDYLSDSPAAMRAVTQPDRVDRKYFLLINPSIMHQAMFCRRRAYERVGPFDEDHFRVAADKDWNIRAFLVAGLTYSHLPMVVSVSTHGGYSTTAAQRLAAEKEIIAQQYFRRSERLYQRVWVLGRRLRLRLETRDFSVPRVLRKVLPGRARRQARLPEE